ncbi:hypothetical protein DKM44_00135 [Deinococcus irradiatisoli]|uniref:Uncharacterized protein n=1 Tax=Deinococcus irradiatisoli TaxID=2202254 RepID=A0A2Z3JIN6_9DEIO|nr:hypothetical protein [Deinococcus irradiatisoli]AWN21838.1 hypothetical protein DKM44_00135 [Deinococcus irradiatisoli]
MTDSEQAQISSDPGDTSPAEGQSQPIPPQDHGQGTGGNDTADRREPAEGGRDEVPGDRADLSSAADNAEGRGRQ